MRRVILASPYSKSNGRTVEENVEYARQCLKDCFIRGDAALVSHLLYTQVLDDEDTTQRRWGIEAEHCWMMKAEALVVYRDHGISPGMDNDIIAAGIFGLEVEYRRLEDL